MPNFLIVWKKQKSRFSLLMLFVLVGSGIFGLITQPSFVSSANDIVSGSPLCVIDSKHPQSSVIVNKSALTAPIIANHTVINATRFDRIPESAIESAKTNLHIAYGHTSHGSQIITGMNGLPAFKEGLGGKKDLYKWNDGPLTGALDLDDEAFANDVGYDGWDTLTRNYLDDSAHSDVNVVIWSWCGQVNDNYDSALDEHYLNRMNQLEIAYPNVLFVYMTGHLEGEGEDSTKGTVWYSNNQIRNYCRTNNKILYDFEDIESFTPDGVNVRAKGADDGCNYDPDGVSPYSRTVNWATQWQSTHTENADWYDCSPAHSEALNGNLKAYAAWWLWARLAGWMDSNNSTATTNSNSPPSGAPNSDPIAGAISWIMANPLYVIGGAVVLVVGVALFMKKR